MDMKMMKEKAMGMSEEPNEMEVEMPETDQQELDEDLKFYEQAQEMAKKLDELKRSPKWAVLRKHIMNKSSKYKAMAEEGEMSAEPKAKDLKSLRKIAEEKSSS